MRRTVQVRVSPEHGNDIDSVMVKARKKARIKGGGLHTRILKKSLDARKKDPLYVFQVEVWNRESDEEVDAGIRHPKYCEVDGCPEVHIIGAGPAGYWAALECLELGLKPVVLERGKDVRARRRDLRAIQQFSEVNPDSNYCFGEGGAGTYSDGKLYTRSTKRGNVRDVIESLVLHGAKEEILTDAHPHIGSNKLPGIITSIRDTITGHGGEVRFGQRVTDIVFENGSVRAVVVNGENEVRVDALILATGHSARDIFAILENRGVNTEFKPFALGVRIEHPQKLIDSIQYNREERGEHLPPAAYRLACQIDDRGVYSFCMCPGGLVVPAATSPGEIVVNGMSLSRRDSPYANAGTVVEVDEKLVEKYTGGKTSMHGLKFQEMVERKCFNSGDGSQAAPSQRLTDFIHSRVSNDLPGASYIPGLRSENVARLLPKEIVESLIQGVRQFDRRMKGYLTSEAVVIATESRTSSPVRIPRDKETMMHPDIRGFFPGGEGAGYAGGIVSAAVDGKKMARAVAKYYESKKPA